MLGNVPSQLQVEIIIKLPVKSLIQCRSISKSWKSLIDSSEFIAYHSVHQTQPERLFIRYQNLQTYESKFLSVADDDTLRDFVPTLPPVVEQLANLRIVGSSQGLFCLYGHCKGYKAVIWNPSIGKSIAVSSMLYRRNGTVLGFGVCPGNREPMIVSISLWCGYRIKAINPWKVEVYTLSMGKWRSLSSNLPRPSIVVTWSQIVLDKFIYWSAFDTVFIDNGVFRSHNLILSFDMANESFEVIDLPDSLSLRHATLLNTVSKLRESLVIFEYRTNPMTQVCDVWVMDHGVQKSFTKLFTIRSSHDSIRKALAFRKSGEPLIETKDHNVDRHGPAATLNVYEPASECIDYFGIVGAKDNFFVNSYVETLLLLNQ